MEGLECGEIIVLTLKVRCRRATIAFLYSVKAGGSRLQLAEGSTPSSCSNGLNGQPRLKLTAE
jgi:hypothetical protein